MKIKVKILYAKGYNNKTKKPYNIYIYALIDTKKKTGIKNNKDNK
ncbi:MAG: hypothetical protein V3574_04320 [Candidatus Moraniibacteriota bacterium]